MLLWCLAIARADVVSDDVPDCPPGSVGTPAHSPFCRPTICDGSCEEGCEPLGLCILEVSIGTTGGVPITREEATGGCETDADCTDGATCEITDRCAAPAPSCGCASAPGPVAAVGAAVLLLGLRLRAVRRRAE